MVFSNRLRSILGHRKNTEIALKTDAALRIPVNHISLAVVIPERTGIDKPFSFQHEHGSIPLPERVLRAHHKDTFIRHPVINIKTAVMVSYCRRPHAFGVLRHIIIIVVNFIYGVIDEFPVHQIFRCQNRKAGHIIKAGRCHIIGIACPDDIRVRIICENNRIFKCAVLQIGFP